jgi:REP element-mobilizing transposase RayT
MKEEDLSRIFHYIGGIIRALSAHVYMVGGRPDHIHILASLPVSLCLSDFVRKIKSNSSRWIKGLGVDYQNFTWQEGYGAFSVSESNKESVAQYIRTQREHHKGRSAQDEYRLFLSRNGFVYDAETARVVKSD